ncbi:DegQ family serine endoprotease [Motiliproteus coralliicola]|uniref:Probable periplasmic serine endoprotease DegP-like n=1 Tax=Motiliproteus coralliicola TaxID=2283196 RepID=A0A369WQ54_9GAMM|nr:DegQ family serine endoprotease [Motiliproteus coralliicola]RDE22696.1 DegQ family serine endoprotease [Motiliproteus coralliicola]
MSWVLLAAPLRAAELPDFTELVEQASPAIVNISSVRNADAKSSASRPQEQLPEIFKRFFGDRGFGGQEFDQQPRRAYPESLGSGFIISDDGYVLTNNHVVKNADSILVRLSDRRELEAKLVGADPRSDLALLKIDADDLPTVPLGDSDRLKVGEWVLAIGSPFGFDHSVTAGIVSATGRSLANENYVPFIQTDVAINPGNSGGPLFNLDGEVVGINSQIYTRSGGFMGLSFAIPISMAMEVVEQLKSKGHVARGWLGVIIQEVNRDLAESFGLDRPMGALVAKVLPDSPAEAAKLQAGDVIISLDGRSIERSAELPQLVGRVVPGKTVDIGVVRDGSNKTLALTVGELPDERSLAMGADGERASGGDNPLKIQVGALEPERAEEWKIDGGVVVRSLHSGPGAEAGLVVGDVITMLNGQPITDLNSFAEVSGDLPENKPVPMRIIRRGSPLFLPLKIKPVE